MDSLLDQVEGFINGQVAGRLNTQWLQVGQDWEPRVVESLGGIAGLCMQSLTQALEGLGEDPPRRINLGLVELQLGLEFESIVQQRLEETRKLLREFVRGELAAREEIFSLNGFAGETEGSPSAAWDQEHDLNRLAGLEALQKSAQDSFQAFKLRVFGDLGQAATSGITPQALKRRLTLAGRWWRSRLRTNARTTLYNVAASARRALDRSLMTGRN